MSRLHTRNVPSVTAILRTPQAQDACSHWVDSSSENPNSESTSALGEPTKPSLTHLPSMFHPPTTDKNPCSNHSISRPIRPTSVIPTPPPSAIPAQTNRPVGRLRHRSPSAPAAARTEGPDGHCLGEGGGGRAVEVRSPQRVEVLGVRRSLPLWGSLESLDRLSCSPKKRLEKIEERSLQERPQTFVLRSGCRRLTSLDGWCSHSFAGSPLSFKKGNSMVDESAVCKLAAWFVVLLRKNLRIQNGRSRGDPSLSGKRGGERRWA